MKEHLHTMLNSALEEFQNIPESSAWDEQLMLSTLGLLHVFVSCQQELALFFWCMVGP